MERWHGVWISRLWLAAVLYFFGWWQEAGDGRDISNFLITPRGANDLHPLLLPFLLLVLSSSLTPPLRSVPSSCSATLSSAGSLYRTDTPWRRSTTSPNHLPTAPFFNLTPTSHQGEPLLYLLLRYRPALSPARYYVQYAAGNTRSIHTSREREYPRFDPSLLVPPLSLSFSRVRALSLSLSLLAPSTTEELSGVSSFFDGSRIPSMLIRALFGTLLCHCRNAPQRQSEIDESALCFDLIKWRADWRGLN